MTYTLHCGDCLEYMQGMADNSVDLVLTDPPYGISINANAKKMGVAKHLSRKSVAETWDKTPPTKEYFDQIFRISKHQIIFGANYFLEHLYSSPCYIVWDKRGHMPKVQFADTEFAWASFRKKSQKYTVINHGFIRDSKDEKTGHPCQKPSELMEMILGDFAKPGQTVFDPFMGSGSVGVACVRFGTHFIGCDLSQHWVDVTRQRIEETAMQPALLEVA